MIQQYIRWLQHNSRMRLFVYALVLLLFLIIGLVLGMVVADLFRNISLF